MVSAGGGEAGVSEWSRQAGEQGDRVRAPGGLRPWPGAWTWFELGGEAAAGSQVWPRFPPPPAKTKKERGGGCRPSLGGVERAQKPSRMVAGVPLLENFGLSKGQVRYPTVPPVQRSSPGAGGFPRRTVVFPES